MTDLLELHVPGHPLLLPNAWDAGSARLFASLGARAVATTSSGFAATKGRPDGQVTREEVLEHCAELAAAVAVPVLADLEDGYATTVDEVAETFRLAAEIGLAGASIEDWSGDVLLETGQAAERVAAAREAAPGLVLTGRAEGYLHGRRDLAEVVARLQAYADSGADVLYAPGLVHLAEIRTLVAEMPRPVNVLLLDGLTVPALADAGVARVSTGGALAWTGWGGAAKSAREFLAGGSDWLADSTAGRREAGLVID
ncbi:MAG: isocitrate lyase/phosphoenolpyruvate mutase family protein [Actinomycetota bacterium]|nr:isocitrate lyase/phosphoenolpyruvate mutase family protein [Actinomycetota bacterium]